jgi:hypothetical protein
MLTEASLRPAADHRDLLVAVVSTASRHGRLRAGRHLERLGASDSDATGFQFQPSTPD